MIDSVRNTGETSESSEQLQEDIIALHDRVNELIDLGGVVVYYLDDELDEVIDSLDRQIEEIHTQIEMCTDPVRKRVLLLRMRACYRLIEAKLIEAVG